MAVWCWCGAEMARAHLRRCRHRRAHGTLRRHHIPTDGGGAEEPLAVHRRRTRREGDAAEHRAARAPSTRALAPARAPRTARGAGADLSADDAARSRAAAVLPRSSSSAWPPRARSRNARCRSLAHWQAASVDEQGAVPRAEDVRHGGARQAGGDGRRRAAARGVPQRPTTAPAAAAAGGDGELQKEYIYNLQQQVYFLELQLKYLRDAPAAAGLALAAALRAGGGRGADRPLDRRAARLVPQDRGRVQGEAGGGGAAAAAAPRGGARVGDARAAHAGGEGEGARAAPARARHVLVGEAGAAGRGDRAAARARALLPRREDGARAIRRAIRAQFSAGPTDRNFSAHNSNGRSLASLACRCARSSSR